MTTQEKIDEINSQERLLRKLIPKRDWLIETIKEFTANLNLPNADHEGIQRYIDAKIYELKTIDEDIEYARYRIDNIKIPVEFKDYK